MSRRACSCPSPVTTGLYPRGGPSFWLAGCTRPFLASFLAPTWWLVQPQDPSPRTNVTQRRPGAAPSGSLLALPSLRADSASTSSDFPAASAHVHPCVPPPRAQQEQSALCSPSASVSLILGLNQDSPTACALLLPPVLLPHCHNPELRAHSASGPRHSLCLPGERPGASRPPSLHPRVYWVTGCLRVCMLHPTQLPVPGPHFHSSSSEAHSGPCAALPRTGAGTGCCDSACP